LCIYISKIKKIENCEKNNVFFLNVKCFKKDFEVNCLYKTRWDSYPGIGEEKKSFLLKN
jgi:hypothetical protein